MLEDENFNDDLDLLHDSSNVDVSMPAYQNMMSKDKKKQITDSTFKKSPSRKPKE